MDTVSFQSQGLNTIKSHTLVNWTHSAWTPSASNDQMDLGCQSGLILIWKKKVNLKRFGMRNCSAFGRRLETWFRDIWQFRHPTCPRDHKSERDKSASGCAHVRSRLTLVDPHAFPVCSNVCSRSTPVNPNACSACKTSTLA